MNVKAYKTGKIVWGDTILSLPRKNSVRDTIFPLLVAENECTCIRMYLYTPAMRIIDKKGSVNGFLVQSYLSVS